MGTEATVTQALEPCPFCGGESWAVNSPVSPSIAIMCRSCGATGGLRDTEAEAIAAWNTRTAASQASDAGGGGKMGRITRREDGTFLIEHIEFLGVGLPDIFAALATLTAPPTSGEEMRLREAAEAALKCLEISVQSFPDVERKLRAALTKGAE